MKILLANVGNRNINYCDKIYSVHSQNDFFSSKSFRDFTKILLEQYDLEKERISLNILPDLIDHLKQGIDQIILFYTDTPEGERNNQDTVYAVQIVANKLIEMYPAISVEIKAVKCKPTDTDALMKRYRMYLRAVANMPDLSFIYICESGGTPQQKTALRLVSEFVFNPDYFKPYTVEVGEDKNIIVREQSLIEYKNVIVEEQVSALAYMGEFNSALTLYKLRNTVSNNKPLINTLEFANALMNNNVKQAVSIAATNFLGKATVDPKIKEQFLGLTCFTQNYDAFSSLMSLNNYLSACVLLSIADWKYNTQQYGEASLFYSIFIENFLTSVINYAAPEFEVDVYGDKFQKFLHALNNGEIFNNFILPDSIDLSKLNGANVPFKIALAEAITNPICNTITEEIKTVNSFYLRNNGNSQTVGIDTLRNKYAHEGKLIKEADFRPFVAFGDKMHQLFNLPPTGIFNQIIQVIYEIMI